jgi:beta-lactam-binding protein with PASTA domain
MRTKAALIAGGALMAVAFIGVTDVRAGTTSCGRPEDAPGFGTPARAGVVPNTVCMDLQLAQEKAHAAGYYGNLRSQDASGRGRHQFYDRDWVVVSQNPGAGTKAAAGTRIVVQVLAYGDRGAPPAPDRTQPGRLPNFACFDLQEAQDTLHSAGFTRMGKEDATGRGRHPIIDRDWTVTGQSPPPGGPYPKSTSVVLKAVKDAEARSCA